MLDNKLVVTSSPHIVDQSSTSKVMRDVIIALMPALFVAFLVFGYRALTLTLVCVAASVAFEYLFNRLTKRENTTNDCSAIITGMLLAYSLPVTFPYWMAIIGCFIAIIVVKQLFGGLGQNFANPANTARIALFISFSTPMTSWQIPQSVSAFPDTVTGATPLGLFAKGNFDMIPSNYEMFIGWIGGCTGEISALAILIGGLYLIARKIISPTIPAVFIATVAIFAILIGQDPLFHILAGGVMLGAFFISTDYTTSPMTEKGKIIYAVGCGVLTMLIRMYAAYPEGVSFAILIMNILTPHINNLTRPKPEGGIPA